MSTPHRTVARIHFEDFDGAQFERLVFAYLLRTGRWRSLEWYGQVGSDLGRDIWGVRDNDFYRGNGENICFQCANHQKLTFRKIKRDLDKIALCTNGVPHKFHAICGHQVSADLRDKIKEHARVKGIYDCEVWSGSEFEEYLRRDTESLLRRFISGEVFPDNPTHIANYVNQINSVDDHEVLVLMSRIFDRPAFYTPFEYESSIPNFKKAISDTIESINTGIRRLRDGTEITRIPSRHHVKDESIRNSLKQIEIMLIRLRSSLEEHIRKNKIRIQNPENPDDGLFFYTEEAIKDLDSRRTEILDAFRMLCPGFDTIIER